jgi:mannitol/fructose-specific phosphotransferase system IIA component (Ntr-type)
MQLKELFAPEDLVLGLEAPDKWAAIARLMEHLAERGKIPEGRLEGLLEQVVARERSMSTGMEHGIAIPHAAVNDADMDSVAACLGIVGSENGLEFESIDARPTQVIVLLLIPRSQKLVHIRTLADIARVLGKEQVRDNLRTATSAQEAWQVLVDGEATHPV